MQITESTQEELEKAILSTLTQIGVAFSVQDAIPVGIHLQLIQLRKNFVAYVDNARLLKTQIKENVTL